MGLYAEFNINDFMYPTELGYGVIADYSAGTQAFIDTFVSQARSMVPVRTGNLMASISGDGGGDGGMLYTDCEYAQYVEYGTWRNPAQPYFEMALESAVDVASAIWDRELHSGLSRVMSSAHSEAEDIRQSWRQEGQDLQRQMYREAQEVFNEMMAEAEAMYEEMLAEGGDEVAAYNTYRSYVQLAYDTKRSIEEEGDALRDYMYMMGDMMAELLIASWELITGVMEMLPYPYAPETMII